MVLVTACCTDGVEVEVGVTTGALTWPATTAGLTMGVASGVTVEGEVEIDTFGVALAGKAAEDSGT